MSSAYLGEIRIFPYTFAPQYWAFCNGQSLPISQNAALYSLLGTTYGGDGRTSFSLPNLQGKFPIQQGQGPGTSNYVLGQTGGATTVTLQPSQLAGHNHSENAQVLNPATDTAPSGDYLLQVGTRFGGNPIFGSDGGTIQMGNASTNLVGGNQPHNNMPLYLTLNYCICLTGVFPPRP